jgi:hypothetical protein
MFGFEWLLMRGAVVGTAGALTWLFCRWKARKG